MVPCTPDERFPAGDPPKDLVERFSTREFRVSLRSSLYSHSKEISTNLYNISQHLFRELRQGNMKDITLEDVKNILRIEVRKSLLYFHHYEYGTNVYGGGISIADLTGTNVTCSFSSSFDIYETQYKSTINEFEFNFSQNPSIISGSTDGTVYDFVTGSFFSPYVSTVGLYDDAQNLLAVGKLSQPLPISRTTDTTIFINIDR